MLIEERFAALIDKGGRKRASRRKELVKLAKGNPIKVERLILSTQC